MWSFLSSTPKACPNEILPHKHKKKLPKIKIAMHRLSPRESLSRYVSGIVFVVSIAFSGALTIGPPCSRQLLSARKSAKPFVRKAEASGNNQNVQEKADGFQHLCTVNSVQVHTCSASNLQCYINH
jgi:hypothetical protein